MILRRGYFTSAPMPTTDFRIRGLLSSPGSLPYLNSRGSAIVLLPPKVRASREETAESPRYLHVKWTTAMSPTSRASPFPCIESKYWIPTWEAPRKEKASEATNSSAENSFRFKSLVKPRAFALWVWEQSTAVPRPKATRRGRLTDDIRCRDSCCSR